MGCLTNAFKCIVPWVSLISALWNMGDQATDIITLHTTYKPEYDRPDGEAWFFKGGVLAMLAPALLATLFPLVDSVRTGEWKWTVLVTAISYPITFPFYNLYIAVQDIRGRASDKDKHKVNGMKLFEILGEALPQTIIAGIWLNTHFGWIPLISVTFSAGSVIYGAVKGFSEDPNQRQWNVVCIK